MEHSGGYPASSSTIILSKALQLYGFRRKAPFWPCCSTATHSMGTTHGALTGQLYFCTSALLCKCRGMESLESMQAEAIRQTLPTAANLCPVVLNLPCQQGVVGPS